MELGAGGRVVACATVPGRSRLDGPSVPARGPGQTLGRRCMPTQCGPPWSEGLGLGLCPAASRSAQRSNCLIHCYIQPRWHQPPQHQLFFFAAAPTPPSLPFFGPPPLPLAGSGSLRLPIVLLLTVEGPKKDSSRPCEPLPLAATMRSMALRTRSSAKVFSCTRN